MKNKITHSIFCSLALMLTAISDLIVTPASVLMWHEPDCPEELLK